MVPMSDDATTAESPGTGKVSIPLPLRATIAGLLALVATSALGGYAVGLAGRGKDFGARQGVALAVLVLLALIAIVWASRTVPQALKADRQVAPRILRARRILQFSFLAGMSVGAAFGILHGEDLIHGREPFSLEVGPGVAAFLIGSLLLMVPVSWAWHRSIDELEERACKDGALIALYAYALIEPAWWLAWRGGLAGAPHGGAIYVVVMFVWSAGWLWRRCR